MAERRRVVTYAMADKAIMAFLGAQLRQMRINAQMKQGDLAERAGVSRSTVAAMEHGRGGTISSLIAVLRHLQKLNVLDAFATEAPLSPRVLAKAKGKIPKRIRADRPNIITSYDPINDW